MKAVIKLDEVMVEGRLMHRITIGGEKVDENGEVTFHGMAGIRMNTKELDVFIGRLNASRSNGPAGDSPEYEKMEMEL